MLIRQYFNDVCHLDELLLHVNSTFYCFYLRLFCCSGIPDHTKSRSKFKICEGSPNETKKTMEKRICERDDFKSGVKGQWSDRWSEQRW